MSNKMGNGFDAEITIKSYKKKVKIKDDYFIEFDPRDSFFIAKVLNLIQDVQSISEKAAKYFEEHSKDSDIDKNLGDSLYNNANSAQIEISKRLNNTFGAEFCIKAFGREVPVLEDVLELLGQLQEIMQKFSEDIAKERSSKFLDRQKAKKRA